jgi:hypothetical protein
MRIVWIGLAGIAVSLTLFGFSQLADGLFAASAYVLALLIPPVSIGLTIAAAINHRLDAPTGFMPRRRRLPMPDESHRCGCGSPMMAMDFAWVCRACDLAPAHR